MLFQTPISIIKIQFMLSRPEWKKRQVVHVCVRIVVCKNKLLRGAPALDRDAVRCTNVRTLAVHSAQHDHRWTSNGKIEYEKWEKQFPHISSLSSNIINSSNSRSCSILFETRKFCLFSSCVLVAAIGRLHELWNRCLSSRIHIRSAYWRVATITFGNLRSPPFPNFDFHDAKHRARKKNGFH